MGARLTGRVAVVTGAAGGIGQASVRRFSEEGAVVVGIDRCPDPIPGLSLSITADVTSSAEVQAAFARAEAELGRIDILFNIVGASGRRTGDGPVDECTEEGWDWVLDVNLRSVFLACKYAIPALRRAGGGSIVNTGSVLGLVGHAAFDTHAYAASKGAVIALTRAMAARYAADRIRVNAVCPGLIRTPMSRRAQQDDAVLGMLPHLQPLTSDFGEAEDVAAAAVYLASDDSRFVTGIILPVDGGWTAQ
jgi:meso-butanediol dehydrogenase / (S,S)-butanediol dehydrogenase / diacetyl reductase